MVFIANFDADQVPNTHAPGRVPGFVWSFAPLCGLLLPDITTVVSPSRPDPAVLDTCRTAGLPLPPVKRIPYRPDEDYTATVVKALGAAARERTCWGVTPAGGRLDAGPARRLNDKRYLLPLKRRRARYPYWAAVCRDRTEAAAVLEAHRGEEAVVCRPFSSSGRGRRLLRGDLSGIDLAAVEYPVILEKRLNRIRDYSLLLWASRDGVTAQAQTGLITNRAGHYLGNTVYPDGRGPLSARITRDVVADISPYIRGSGYTGPCGADLFSLTGSGEFHISEINGRYTIGHLARRLQRRLTPFTPGRLKILSCRKGADSSDIIEMLAKTGISFSSGYGALPVAYHRNRGGTVIAAFYLAAGDEGRLDRLEALLIAAVDGPPPRKRV